MPATEVQQWSLEDIDKVNAILTMRSEQGFAYKAYYKEEAKRQTERRRSKNGR